MSVFEMVILMVFVVPIIALCIGFVLCASLMQIQEEETACAMNRAAAAPADADQQIADRYRAYAAQVSSRRYIRPAGAMIRASH